MIKNREFMNMALARVPQLIQGLHKNSAMVKDLLASVETQARKSAVPLAPIWGLTTLLMEEGERMLVRLAKNESLGLNEKFRDALVPYRALKENVMESVHQYQRQVQEDELRQVITEVHAYPVYDLEENNLETRIAMYCREQKVLDSTMNPEAFVELAIKILEGVALSLKLAEKQGLGAKKGSLPAIKKAARRLIKIAETIAGD